MTLSIVIPAYNAETFLPQCLDSIFSQNAEEDDYEVICVDDGSKDNTASILEGYTRYRNFHYLSKHNEGVSIARNTAISLAKGDYIWCVDADDLVIPDAIFALIQMLKNENPQVALCDTFLRFTENVPVNKLNYSYSRSLDYSYIYPCVTNQIIPQRKILLDNNIIYDTEMFLGEDILWARYILAVCNDIVRITSPIYFYRVHPNSVTYTQDAKQPSQKVLLCNKLRLLKSNVGTLSDINQKIMCYNINRTINSMFCSLFNTKKDYALEMTVYNKALIYLWILLGRFIFLRSFLQRMTYIFYPIRPYYKMISKGIF